MIGRSIKIPGPDHPITISRNPNRVVVRLGGRLIAETHAALTLREVAYPPVHYIPRADADMALLSRSETRTWCPYKGEASYFSIVTDATSVGDAVWTYETPHESVAAIEGHLAFYPDRVDAIEERPTP